TFAIPRNLAAQEGDSESQKLYKRKKIHQLASAAKREAEETAYKERQSAWQKFNRKFEKKGGAATNTNITRNQGPHTVGKVQVNAALLQSAHFASELQGHFIDRQQIILCLSKVAIEFICMCI
ncbi:MAG: hypothetical protein EZS28_024901, partial [Streblomastix strix]